MFWIILTFYAGGALGLLFAVGMSIWIWRTRPARTVPAYRRTGPDDAGRYPSSAPWDGNGFRPANVQAGSSSRLTLDGRRRLAPPVAM